MSQPTGLNLSAAEATAFIRDELAAARSELAAGEGSSALDGWVRALGLALQLEPSFIQEALSAILAGASMLIEEAQADAWAALGPALVELVDQVRRVGALPATPMMHTWAAVITEIGALIGHVALAAAIAPTYRSETLAGARRRAMLLDEVTASALSLGDWIDNLVGAWPAETGA